MLNCCLPPLTDRLLKDLSLQSCTQQDSLLLFQRGPVQGHGFSVRSLQGALQRVYTADWQPVRPMVGPCASTLVHLYSSHVPDVTTPMLACTRLSSETVCLDIAHWVPTGGYQCAFSPDGALLAYDHFDHTTGEPRLIIVETLTGAVHVVDVGACIAELKWSSDSCGIALASPSKVQGWGDHKVMVCRLLPSSSCGTASISGAVQLG